MNRHANPAVLSRAPGVSRTLRPEPVSARSRFEAHSLQAGATPMSATGRHSFTTGTIREARRALERRRTSLLARHSTPEIERELVELNAALARMEAGTWGRCERCEGAIGRDRLRALPETRLCLPCARLPTTPEP